MGNIINMGDIKIPKKINGKCIACGKYKKLFKTSMGIRLCKNCIELKNKTEADSENN